MNPALLLPPRLFLSLLLNLALAVFCVFPLSRRSRPVKNNFVNVVLFSACVFVFRAVSPHPFFSILLVTLRLLAIRNLLLLPPLPELAK